MALGTALVDRARVIAQQATGARVEGTTVVSEVRGEWFRARLTLPPGEETDTGRYRSDQAGRSRPVWRARLLFGVKDLDGSPVTLRYSQRVEVNSKQLGRGVYEVQGDPEPIRKKKKVIGYQASIVRIDEAELDRLVPLG